MKNNLNSEAIRDGIEKFCVGAMIVKEGMILLLQRHPSDFMPNLWELPSGGVNQGEDFHEALRREVKEETGLDLLKIDSYLGYFDYRSAKGRRTRQFNFKITTHTLEPIVLSPQEHSAFAWTAVDDHLLSKEIRNIIIGSKLLD